MDKNLIVVLVFLLVVIIILWCMPNMKIETIGGFFGKIVTPISAGLAISFSSKKIAKIWNGKKRSK